MEQRTPRARFDGGTLDCGSGLLLLIRKHIDPLSPGEILEFTSLESSVEVDLPAWCNLTGNRFLSCVRDGDQRIFLIAKAGESDRNQIEMALLHSGTTTNTAKRIAPLPIGIGAVMGIGSWPRPKWMLRAIHDQLSGRIEAAEFEEIALDAIRLSVQSQERAEVDVVTDGEQRRDSYASFIGKGIENCQLIPLVDVLAYVDDPEEFSRELQALDIPAGEVRHPMVFGKLRRSFSVTRQEAEALHSLSEKPSKVAIPGPYLLSRMMWMDCVVDRAYADRESLSADLVQILREEVADLLDAGVSLIQIDEPILTEVVFGHALKRRSFMCGILGEKKSVDSELAFARDLLNQVVRGFPTDRLALHMCRGNWSPDESHAIQGNYRALISTLNDIEVGTLLLEMATERAGEADILRGLNDRFRLGLGVFNQKRPNETLSLVKERVRKAYTLFGKQRLLFTPDCGFATFADNPIDSAEQAEMILATIRKAVRLSDS